MKSLSKDAAEMLRCIILLSMLTLVSLGGCAFYQDIPAPDRQDEVEPDENMVKLAGVYFSGSSWQLSKKAKEILDSDARTLKENPNMVVRLYGWSNAKYTREKNLGLAEKRARTVYDYLASQGVEWQQMEMTAFGMRGETGEPDKVDQPNPDYYYEEDEEKQEEWWRPRYNRVDIVILRNE